MVRVLIVDDDRKWSKPAASLVAKVTTLLKEKEN